MVAMVAAKFLLVPRSVKRCLAPSFFKLEEVIFYEVLLMYLVEGEHPWRPELDVGGKDSLRPVDQEERSLPSGFGGGSPNGPQDGLKVV
jgi:hypothetical protein